MGEVEDRGAAFLEHFGVKGMKWGVRKSPEKAAAKAEKKLVKADKKWEKKQFTLNQGIKRHNEMATLVNANIDRFNNDPRWVGKNLLTDKKADQEYTDAFNKEVLEPAFRIAVERVHGTSPSGRLKMDVKKQPDGTLQMYVRKNDAKHADDGMGTYLFSVTYDANGFITSLEPKTDSMQQADEFVGNFLEHYGVKGMKWGVRKSDVPAGETRVTQKGKKLKGEGGKGLPAHEDAKKAAVSKQKAKGSGLQSLSNQELKDLANRMNLEQQVRQLSLQDKQANSNPAARFIKRTLTQSGKQEAQKAANNATSKLVANMMKAK